MAIYRTEIGAREPGTQDASSDAAANLLRGAGLTGLRELRTSRLFFLEGELGRQQAEHITHTLLMDPVAEVATVQGVQDSSPQTAAGTVAVEVHPRPGVMDPVAESTLTELQKDGQPVEAVRTGRRYVLAGKLNEADVVDTVGRVLANDCIEEIVVGTAGLRAAPRPPKFEFTLRHVSLTQLDDAALEQLSRSAHLFLSLDEMRAVQTHFRALKREPTDLEVETIAQTWSEHCVHKTLRSAVAYHGAPLPRPDGEPVGEASETKRYANLLKDTIARATKELMAADRGPECLSVFEDNAGIITFDDDTGIAFKAETHNHPSAIEPYGGAATGIGGVIRDVIGCGLAARPIASTDVFCVAPGDWPQDRLPKGVLHPKRVLRGIVSGVADYGNRMGIPTVNGAVYFDPRYLGNPLVFCGSVGVIPRDRIAKEAQPGDHVVVIGGRTGRDGIHGATFSSAELTDTHADEFSHAVQIGNAITEKRFLDAILQARDAEGGCLYTAVTDCGAGGLSSAVGEMSEKVGATVDLDKVPLKYAGLRYDEIWISEAQERMVLAVPPANLARFLEIMRAEEVEATVIGTFGTASAGPRLVLHYNQQVVGDLDLQFLHHGVPQMERVAEWQPSHTETTAVPIEADITDRLLAELARPNVASKEWIIRLYDHEVQGGSVVKPLLGPGRGPGDAAVLQPRLDSQRGIAVACGMAPHLADVDPYWMAAASIDEAIRNVVCVGADPGQVAILDNFCWGRTDDSQQLGALVRACQACYDAAITFGTPFISGKDSLNNEFALDPRDVEPLLATLRSMAAGANADAEALRRILPTLETRIREQRRLAIPATLLISALGLVENVAHCITPDLKQPGDGVLLVGGLPPIGFSLSRAASIHRTVADLIRAGLIRACHDVTDGGWLTALAEMAFTADRGVNVDDPSGLDFGPFDERCATYLIEPADNEKVSQRLNAAGIAHSPIATVTADATFTCQGRPIPVASLRENWSGRQPSH